ncbi:uncharacterized protein BX664DRAFT_346394 [Halteromyces radiatus]|uniref:uncharacterized protein n=1 Tax=Halteromyces radiatus TaxID=101107 RepID=UPI00221FBEFA|nr:uncharacterized protein BX664DRAFT_346394 [Halteromyces radiatus]KAI8096328.1 hypothetical protein BX664DRAFT_346394 [Halteromyces radiatus]
MLLVISLVLVFMIVTSILEPDVAKNSGLYSQMSDGHHYFVLSFWSDEDHGVLIFVCLRAMDLVEDDQFLESFMNLVTEFCAQVGGGQNATPNCYDDIGFTGGTKHSMVQPSYIQSGSHDHYLGGVSPGRTGERYPCSIVM